MSIQDLIAEKREQISLLERHITILEKMADEEGKLSTDRRGRGSTLSSVRRKQGMRRPGRGRRGNSRASMIEKYLRSRNGPQPAKNIAAALGMKPADVHGAIHAGLKSGRFVRGKEKASYRLGSGAEAARPPRKRARARRAKRSAKRVTKSRATSGADGRDAAASS